MAESKGETAGLARTSAGVALWAGLALLSGFAMDATIAALFGIGMLTDAFFIAATIPFALTAVLAASANQALVPQFNTWYENDTQEVADSRVGGLLGSLLLLATAVAIVGIALSGVLPDILASGASEETRSLASSLIALLFLMLIPRAAAESLRALLNSRFSFTVPAASPIVLNVVALTTAILLEDRFGITAVAIGYLVGSVAQVTVLAISTWRRSIRVRPTWGFSDPDVREGLRLLVLPTAGTGLNLFARIFERFLASFLASGAITTISYAWRILNAIGGTVFFRSVTVVLIPRLTKHKGDPEATKRILRTGVRVMLAISIPLMTFLMVFAEPAIGVLFQRGAFSGEDTAALGSVLAIYVITLPFVGVTRALLTYFYSRLDMVTPFMNRVINTAVNMAFGAILIVPFGLTGLALGYVLASVASFAHAWIMTRRRVHVFDRRMLLHTLALAAASLIGVGLAWVVYNALPPAASWLERFATLAVAGVVWLIVLAISFTVLSVDYRPSDVKRMIR
ncbi:MAG: murein biosynthesis integral membrane protein MurJ [Actinobacteria bacterium]|nr:MAG: murein biosynthesis integral membrane protein MurJ [Actinomycetota bacterium]